MQISFRPLVTADYPLFAQWLAEPHVAEWWHDGPATVAFVARYYNDPKSPMHIAVGDGRPFGVIQSYWNSDYPEHAEKITTPKSVGVDLLIGPPELIGHGYGTAMLQEFIAQVIRPNYPAATSVIADPDIANIASVRAFEKAGFRKGRIVEADNQPEQLMILSLAKS